jgi:glycosyltransferase involved in cell wall biosynthesis
LLGRLGALAAELGIADRVSWKGGLAQDDVLAHYRQSDIFGLACRITPDGDRDGLPNVLVEASSQGLVCVSTDISGVPELLDDGVNGFVVPPEDPAALAAALERLMRDPALRQRLGSAAEQRVRSAFDHHSSIRQLTGLFEREWQISP